MPISSSEIAALNGGFQGLAANNLAYSQAIGQGSYGDNSMAGAMNRASSIGGPLASGAMGLLGLDPLSMGLRAGMGAYGAGAGLGGAALAGAGVALPLMAVGAGVSYAGGQMMTGARQQMGLHNALRNSFSFRNGSGGQGFSRTDMSGIGEMVRTMSEQIGPGGEIASFSELSTLAGKMGSMGMAQGVRDIKEFGHRFKEMVSTLKTMATDLGTSLEGAMEFAQASKGSGIFGMGRTAAFTSAARAATVSGGLALSEVTGAASMGSQISRSMGGLGRQGAMAGIRTIGQIGTAQQMGVINEEDIYNATGLTGAEGRQAFAASQMQRTAGFLQSGRGRRLIASMAMKDGTLDEGAVQELLGGGMSISETMRRDQGVSQGTRMSRANFIRNEGRLRGAAMERLGAFLPALQLQEWAQSKGIDINNMDDRSMLFAQRQLGMGRDEMDAAMKMVNAMPQILEQQRRSEQQDQYFQQAGQVRKGQGLEGLKQRFGHAREAINSRLQKVGQDIFNEGSQQVDEFMNKLLGTYVETYSKDIDDAYQAMRQGGATGRQAAGRAFGIGGGRGVFAKAFGTGGLQTGAQSSRLDLLSGSKGAIGDILGNPMEIGRYLMHGQSAAGRLAAAGVDLTGAVTSQQIQAKMQTLETSRLAAATGFNDAQVKLGSEQGGDWLRRSYAMDRVTGSNDQRMASFEGLLKSTASGGGADAGKAQKLLEAWNGAKSQAEKAQLMANIERGNQIQDNYALANNLGVPGDLAAQLNPTHGFTSERAGNEAWARAMGFTSKKEITTGGKFGVAAGVGLLTGALNTVLPGAGAIAALAQPWLQSMGEGLLRKGAEGDFNAVGGFYRGKQGRDLLAGVFDFGSAENRAATQDKLMRQIGTLEKDDPVRGEMQKLLGAGQFADLMAKNGGKVSDADIERIARAHDMSPEQLKAYTKNAYGALTSIQNRDREEEGRRVRQYATSESKKLAALGVYDAATGKLAVDTSKFAKGSRAAVEAAVGGFGKELQAELAGDLAGAYGQMQGIQGALGGLSTADKRRLAEQFAGSNIGAEIQGLVGAETRFAGLSRRRGVSGAAASFLGVDMSREEASHLDLTTDAGARRLLARAGMTDASADTIKELTSSARAGGNTLADTLKRLADSMQKDKEDEASKKESEKDEIQKAMKTNSDKANMLLEALVNSNKAAVVALGELKKKNDPEGGNKPDQPAAA